MPETLNLDDKTGHLIVVNIRFNKLDACVKTLMYNETHTQFLKKIKQQTQVKDLSFNKMKH